MTNQSNAFGLTSVMLGITAFGALLFSPLRLLTVGRQQRLWDQYQAAVAADDEELARQIQWKISRS